VQVIVAGKETAVMVMERVVEVMVMPLEQEILQEKQMVNQTERLQVQPVEAEAASPQSSSH
jgi:hypothetical protein